MKIRYRNPVFGGWRALADVHVIDEERGFYGVRRRHFETARHPEAIVVSIPVQAPVPGRALRVPSVMAGAAAPIVPEIELVPPVRRVVPDALFAGRPQRALVEAIRHAARHDVYLPDEAPPGAEPETLRVDSADRATWPKDPEAPWSPPAAAVDAREAGAIHRRGGWPAPLLALLCTPDDSGARDWVVVATSALASAGDVVNALQGFAALGDDDARARLLAARTSPGRPAAEAFLRWSPSEAPEVAALERRGRRLDAAELADRIARERGDGRMAMIGATIRARLALASTLALTIGAVTTTFVLAPKPVLGRTGAEISIAAPVVSRRHLRFSRLGAVATVEDLGSQNGTILEGGERLTGVFAVERVVALNLGGSVRCLLEPGPSGLAVEALGVRRVLTLGPLAIGNVSFEATPRGVRVNGVRTLDDARIAGPIEVAIGDRLRGEIGPDILVAPPTL